ncbi:hypothetical protein F5Y09DRAFT_211030 [Xylaria sp. FL1042]|nr:hypothetical protein F5Y09DRAFT_211030 [Xylaria sp. FL1042]
MDVTMGDSYHQPPRQPEGSMASMTASYRHYPHLTKEEFAEICHYFDAKYCRAPLGVIRNQWRVNVHTALDTCATSPADLVTFLQITKPLKNSEIDDQLTSRLGNVALEPPAPARRSRRLASQSSAADSALVKMEEADKEVLRSPSRAIFQSVYVVYEIHLHPTYQAPCLWFTLHNLPIDESPLDIDSVFRHLVPDAFKNNLRASQGGIGGISIDHHPITGVPTFFVHPCYLGDIISEFECPKDDYLMTWLGLTGSCVGLWVPKEMAIV